MTEPASTTAEFPEEMVEVRHGEKMILNDGTQLLADVYTPRGDGPFPVLLMRQPYGRDIASTVVYAQPPWFARRGFIVVIQDVRGRGGSSGLFEAFVNEGQDGYEAVEWASNLPKSNGNVGMYGFSYQASTQLLAAAERPPALKAIAPHMTAFDLYSGWFYRAGLLQVNTTLGWGAQMLREDARRQQKWDLYRKLEAAYANGGALQGQLPHSSVTPLTDPQASGYVADWLEHDRYDEYWAALDMLTAATQIAEVPCFHLAGWYDYYLRGSMDGFRAMQALAPEKQQLVVGPWIHIPWGTRIAGTDCGPQARYAVDEALVDWMQRWCGDSPAQPASYRVQYFSMGDLRWHKAQAWPPESARTTRFYLSSTGAANSVFGDGRILEVAAAVRGVADRFVYDPEVPVLAPGAVGPAYHWGPVDITPSLQGNNLLVYRSEPFPTPRRFAGQPELHVFVRSSAEHTAFVARISRQDGSGWQFLSLGAAETESGERQDDGSLFLVIKLDDTAFHVGAGECLCIDIASSAWPLLARHPNTDAGASRVTGPQDFKRAVQVVLHDPIHRSQLVLQEIPHE